MLIMVESAQGAVQVRIVPAVLHRVSWLYLKLSPNGKLADGHCLHIADPVSSSYVSGWSALAQACFSCVNVAR